MDTLISAIWFLFLTLALAWGIDTAWLYFRYERWHRWFAWFPFRRGGKFIWLRMIERRLVLTISARYAVEMVEIRGYGFPGNWQPYPPSSNKDLRE